MKFVVQEQYASTRHFDFRLKNGGISRGWVVPKSVPDRPGPKRVALNVADHGVSCRNFEVAVPKGEFGASRIKVWDRGACGFGSWSEETMAFTLYGSRAEDRFDLLRFAHDPPNNWLLVRLPGGAGRQSK